LGILLSRKDLEKCQKYVKFQRVFFPVLPGVDGGFKKTGKGVREKAVRCLILSLKSGGETRGGEVTEGSEKRIGGLSE